MGVLDGRVALVTGASSGMGQATARLFAQEGATVVLAARRGDLLQALADEINDSGGRVLSCPTDLTDRAAVDALVAATLDRFGALHILCNPAGTNIKRRALTVLDPAEWDGMVDINLTGAYNVTRAVLPAMRAQRDGIIIHVSSGAVQAPDVSGVAYQATKHGMVGLTHGTMAEEKANGIRCTVLFPGLTDTPLLDKRPVPTPPEVVAQALQSEDVAAACLFIAALPPRAYVPDMRLLPSTL